MLTRLIMPLAIKIKLQLQVVDIKECWQCDFAG
jgi:hypothetical protein